MGREKHIHSHWRMCLISPQSMSNFLLSLSCVSRQVSSINRVLRNLAAQKEQTHTSSSQQQAATTAATAHLSASNNNNNNNNNGNDSPGASLCDSVYDKLRLLNGHHHHAHPHMHLGSGNSAHQTGVGGHHPSVTASPNCWPPRPPSWYPGTALNGGSGAFALQSISPGGGSASGGIGSCTVLSTDEINSKKGEFLIPHSTKHFSNTLF
jgi:hypothetical protein